VHDYLKSLCSDVQITRGEYDEDTRYPETKQLIIGAFKLGICHGHQVGHPSLMLFVETIPPSLAFFRVLGHLHHIIVTWPILTAG
jgi:predicted phosphodiesterase